MYFSENDCVVVLCCVALSFWYLFGYFATAVSVGPPEWSGALREYQVPAVCEATFLDGCRIFLAGFSDQELEKLHKIVNVGGGAR